MTTVDEPRRSLGATLRQMPRRRRRAERRSALGGVATVVLSGAVALCLSLPTAPAAAAVTTGKHDRDGAVKVLGYHACTADKPCQVEGTYVLGEETPAPGLRFTVPAGGWTINEVTHVEVNLIPPGEHGAHGDRMALWADPLAVQPDGPDEGALRPDVGTSPRALVRWFETQSAFLTTPAHRVVIGHTFRARSLDLQASFTARTGDPDCPAAPRCVTVFSHIGATGPGGISIGGDETLRLNIGAIRIDRARHTFMVGLDAIDPADLAAFQVVAQPIEDSIRVPRDRHHR